MDIKEVSIRDIKPYDRNPRKNDPAVDAVAKSIQEFGFRQPVVCDMEGVIIVGHTRYKAAKKLGLKTVPVHYADLSEQQAKAYRLADNKSGELADWDLDLLGEELDGILDFDMLDFGFDSLQIEKTNNDEFPDIEQDLIPRLQHNVFDNFERDFQPTYVGKYDIPLMQPTHTTSNSFARFCDWKEEIPERKETIAHIYYDDYKFSAIWSNPDLYIDRLREFKAVVSPDFSLYTDFPVALQILSCYKRQWIAAYWQSLGLDVIPDVVWGESKSFEFCFDGIPKGGTIAVSSVGVANDRDWNGKDGDLFLLGYEEMLKRIEPETILFYGKVPDGVKGNIVHIPTFYDKRRGSLQDG